MRAPLVCPLGTRQQSASPGTVNQVAGYQGPGNIAGQSITSQPDTGLPGTGQPGTGQPVTGDLIPGTSDRSLVTSHPGTGHQAVITRHGAPGTSHQAPVIQSPVTRHRPTSHRETRHQSIYQRNKKNNVYPCKPQFYYIKVAFKRVKIL